MAQKDEAMSQEQAAVGTQPANSEGKKMQQGPARITLEEYLQQHSVHIGLVASFRYEARERPELLQSKTDAEWNTVLQEQSTMNYK
ncbi:hypothetical protein [Paenibacillus shenyangensis]|uniref:hypothetical protein n=1 Tax=Paenibacillus sp. A9 TaxID=1284352 RepID=UPI00035CC823|nr:hypothetical protein [Paenibacillus sp. A9]